MRNPFRSHALEIDYALFLYSLLLLFIIVYGNGLQFSEAVVIGDGRQKNTQAHYCTEFMEWLLKLLRNDTHYKRISKQRHIGSVCSQNVQNLSLSKIVYFDFISSFSESA